MARIPRDQHRHQTALANDPSKDISANQWNDVGATTAHIETGIFGLPTSVGSVSLTSNTLTPVDTSTIVKASSGSSDTLNFIDTLGNNDQDIFIFRPFTGHTITVANNASSPPANTGVIITLTGANMNLDTNIPLILQRNGNTFYQIALNLPIVNANVAAGAALAYSKLNLTGSILNADISVSASIDPTKINGTAGVLNGSQTWSNRNTFSPTTTNAITINPPTGPTGSSSAFKGGILTNSGTTAFITTPQTGDYTTNYIDQTTLTNPSSGTITNASSLKIVGAPIASTNVTITNNYALWVAAGNSLFSGNILTTNFTIQDTTAASSTVLNITRSSGNNTAGVAVSPSGSTRQSGFYAFRTSDITTNYEVVMLISDFGISNEHALYVNKGGTGSFRPLNMYNNSTKLMSLDTAATITAYVDFAQTTAKKIGFNVGLTNYIYESAANVMSFVTSSTEAFRIGTTGGIGIISGQKFNLDGVSLAGDTYIYESSANVFDLFVGGTNTLRSSATTIIMTGTTQMKGELDIGNDGVVHNLVLYDASNNKKLIQCASNNLDFYNNAVNSNILRLSDTGLFTVYDARTTAGIGVVPVFGSTLQKAETGADTNVLTITPPAVAGRYRASVTWSVSAATAATMGWTLAWTDSNGHAQTPANLPFFTQNSTTVGLTNSVSANVTYSGSWEFDVDNSGANIIVKTTFSGTSVAYKISAQIEQLA